MLGQATPQLNLALDCWAKLVIQGAAEVEPLLTRPEWLYFADCLNGHTFSDADDRESLALSVQDAHEFDGIGDKWFESEVCEHVAEFTQKLRTLSYPAVWTIVLAVQFFWENHSKLNTADDEWWRVSFRTRWNRDDNAESSVSQS